MEISIPQDVSEVLAELTVRLRTFLDEELIGVYLHGSLAMNCFNPVSSDIDLLIVVRNELSFGNGRQARKTLLELSNKAPAKGFEISIVSLESLKHFEYPAPYELHFADRFTQDFEDDRVDSTA